MRLVGTEVTSASKLVATSFTAATLLSPLNTRSLCGSMRRKYVSAHPTSRGTVHKLALTYIHTNIHMWFCLCRCLTGITPWTSGFTNNRGTLYLCLAV